ncbi:unnamed protein product [Dovyalis caffra]|uniref:Uncharacterized protein n=1 Tax=Dovyalis caffra TaxID=77055 RepID=A0AAV1S6U3_9ROSI|nr:unnamed protein product [Dovyalis caffra]
MFGIQDENVICIVKLKIINETSEKSIHHVHIYLPKDILVIPVKDELRLKEDESEQTKQEQEKENKSDTNEWLRGQMFSEHPRKRISRENTICRKESPEKENNISLFFPDMLLEHRKLRFMTATLIWG